jgi:hypothetical protein
MEEGREKGGREKEREVTSRYRSPSHLSYEQPHHTCNMLSSLAHLRGLPFHINLFIKIDVYSV